MRYIDMHIHTNASDGSCSPSEVVKLAADSNLAAIAITDHDTVDGVKEAMEASQIYNMDVVPGVEMSAIYNGVEIHILGYFMDYENQQLLSRLDSIKQARYDRNEAMCERFKKDGINMTMERLSFGHGNTVITRAHFARILIEDGICKDMNQAFKKYLHKKSKYYIPTPDMTAKEAVELITEYGKAAFIAHPLIYGFGYSQIEEMLIALKEFGITGLEAYHSSNNCYESGRLRELARKHGLLISGGSDFHGAAKPDIKVGFGRGGLHVTEAVYTDMLNSICK